MLGRSRAARLALLLAIASLGASLAGCGGSSDNGVASKTAPEILAATRAAAQSASSVHVNSESGIGITKSALDAALGTQQGHTRLSFAGLRIEEIRTGSTLYVKGNRVLDARLESTLGVKIPSGVWLKGTVGGPLPGTALTSITKELPVILSSPGQLTKGPTTTIDGKPAIELKQTTPLYTGTLYVATTGKPYPILLRKTGRETGEITFTGWNDPITVSAPANALDISKLERKAG